MKKYIFVFIMCTFAFNLANAGNYFVYIVSGAVVYKSQGKTDKVVAQQKIDAHTYVELAQDAQMVILDEETQTLFTIKGVIKGELCNLVKKDNVVARKVSEQYVSYIIKKGQKQENTAKNTYMQSTATSYRDIDSTLNGK